MEVGMGVGRRLRQARTSRGMSLADVARATKIPVRLLEGLEGEQYEVLPAGIFGRGYVRAVAQTVGLDGNELAHAFGEEIAPPAAEPPPDAPGPEGPRLHLAPDDSAPRRWPVRMAAAVLLVVSVVLVILWLGRDRPAARTSSTASPVSSAASPAAPAVPVREVKPVGTTGTRPATVSAGRELALAIEAVRPCWVVLTVDGERVVYRLMQPGDRAAVPVKARAVLHTGDAAALAVTLDGRRQAPIGLPGQVRTVEITPGSGMKPLVE
jgi:cytoskeletal protein RodZ